MLVELGLGAINKSWFVNVLTCKRAHMPQSFEHRTQTPQ